MPVSDCSKYHTWLRLDSPTPAPGTDLANDPLLWQCKYLYASSVAEATSYTAQNYETWYAQETQTSQTYIRATFGLLPLLPLAIVLTWAILHARRKRLFQIRQLHEAALATRDADRHALAKIETRVEDELERQKSPGSIFALQSGPNVPLAETVSIIQELAAFTIKGHDPREQLALERERQHMGLVRRQREIEQDLKAEIPRFNRELDRLYREHQQARWDGVTKELTEVRKVIVGAVAEFRNNPAFHDKLKYILDTFGDFEKTMQTARSTGTLSDSAVGKLLDTMMTDAFHQDVKHRTGASAKSNGH